MTRLVGIFVVAVFGCGPQDSCVRDGECGAANDDDGGSGTSADAAASSGADVDTDQGPDPGPDTPGGNNWACLSNGDYPAGLVDDPTLRKVIAYTMSGDAASLDLGPMTISRMSTTSTFVRSHVPVTNVSASTRCFIEMEALSFSDGSAELVADQGNFVQGSVGDVGGGLYTDTCLAPSESGYFLGITEVDFELIGEASFVIDDPDTLATAPLQSAVPTGYAVDGSDVDITVEHVGGGDINAPDNSIWLLRDAAGQPVVWGFADAPGESIMSLGDTRTYQSSESFLEQVGSNVCFWLDFAAPTDPAELVPPVACRADEDPESCEHRRWGARTAELAAQAHSVRQALCAHSPTGPLSARPSGCSA